MKLWTLSAGLTAALVVSGPVAAPTETQTTGKAWVREHYTRHDHRVPMRDGARLFTSVYVPKTCPAPRAILLNRTPYSVAPYGVDSYPDRVGPSEAAMKEGFVFAYQDVRGLALSEGDWVDVRPLRPSTAGEGTDESTDAWDTVDWLVKNVPCSNGRVGMWGISYPGFYALAGLVGAHPALKAVSPQAPVTDLYLGDDAFHNGAFMLAANFGFYAAFKPRPGGPARPVPYVGHVQMGMQGDYMTEDQRFAATRPDVLVYETPPLEEDLTVLGPIGVELYVATSGTDSDFVVKVIDVYPNDFPAPEWKGEGVRPANHVRMGGYQQLVRGEPFRGKFRRSLERPEPFAPDAPDVLRFDLPDVAHVFRRGHRVMVQVQSSWFPLTDRNPQTFVDIPRARPDDFRPATQRVFRSKDRPSAIVFRVEIQAVAGR